MSSSPGCAATLALALALCPSLGVSAQAADPNAHAKEPPPVATAPRRLETPVERVAGSVTVIGREEIERRQRRSLPDVLEEVPGLNVVQTGGVGKQTSIFTRGTNSDHTLVLLDGIEIMDPSLPRGSFDYAHLLTQNVERIEVLRGPQSALYGSDALGGVVNIVTRRGEGPRTLSAWAEAGAYNTFQTAAAVHGGNALGDYSLSFTNLHSRGFSVTPSRLEGHEDDNYTNNSLSSRLGFRPGGGLELDFVGHLIDTHNEVDAGLDDPDSDAEARQLFWRGEARHQALAGRLEQRFGVALTDYDRKDSDRADPVSPGSAHTSHDGTRLKLDWQAGYQLNGSHRLSLGAETERERVDSFSDFGDFEQSVDESLRSSAAWIQEEFAFGDRLFGSIALRLDHHDEFGSQTTYRTGATYIHPQTSTRLRASVGAGFKAPGLDDLFGVGTFEGFPAFVGNPNLEPEKSVAWEVGIEQPLLDGNLKLGTTWFRTKVRNLIDFSFDPVLFVSTLENRKRAEIHGFESFLHAQIAERLWLRLDHTYLSAEDDALDEDLLRRPKHKLTARLDVRPFDSTGLSLGVLYIGPRKDVDFTGPPFGRVSEGGYTVVNLAATHDVSPRWTLFGRIDNLFDRSYEDPATFASGGFAGYVGIRLRYSR